jgi:putative DNA primase/helicase
MESHEFRKRVDGVKARANGNWTQILGQLLHEPSLINRKNQACPKCAAGTDRFQYTDKFGAGDAHCRNCGHIDGFELLQCGNGWSFAEAFKAVEERVGNAQMLPSAPAGDTGAKMRRLARQLWQQAHPIVQGDPVDCYLRSRGLGMDAYPESLRTHPALGYYAKLQGARKATLVRNIPAMLALLQDESGQTVTLHRTYVEQGAKARVPDPKKCLSSFNPGPAIRLGEPSEALAITEGIETALAIHLRLGKPVWATFSASNMEHVLIPACVRRVCIYADHDASYTGQAAAYALARRLKSQEKTSGEREVQVFIPAKPDTDWADVWAARLHKQKLAA